MKAQIIKDGKVILKNVLIYDTFFKRLHGLMFKKSFPMDGVLLVPCKQIHTFFMAFPIDVIFLNKEGIVLDALPSIEPGKVSKLYKSCQKVLELPSKSIFKHNIETGNLLEIEETALH